MKVTVASAGTGKTTYLVQRTLQLVQEGTPLRRMAGITYTRNAAAELRQRVHEGLHQILDTGAYFDLALAPTGVPKLKEARRELAGATLSTIHGFMGALLRLNAPLVDLPADFGTPDEWVARTTFEQVASSVLYVASDRTHPLYADAFRLGDNALELLMALFNNRSLTREIRSAGDPDEEALVRLFSRVYRSYLDATRARLSPAELERYALKLLEYSQATERIARRYQVVLVDEYQDVNPLQGEFFRQLEALGVRVEVVGDPKQSIYLFRQADVRVFREALAGDGSPHTLDVSYRHAPNLVTFLNHLTGTLSANGLGFETREAPVVQPDPMRPLHKAAGQVEVHHVVNEEGSIDTLRETEATLLVERLQHHHRQGRPYGEMAILCRSHSSIELTARALAQADVPHVVLFGKDYHKRHEVSDLKVVLQAALEPSGSNLAAYLLGPYGALSTKQVDEVLRDAKPLTFLARSYPEVYAFLQGIMERTTLSPAELLDHLLNTPFRGGQYYRDFLGERARHNADALLMQVAMQPGQDLPRLLRDLAAITRYGEEGDQPQHGEGVKLLTVHRSKGLEWPLVALFDCGRGERSDDDKLKFTPENLVALKGSEAFEAAKAHRKALSEHESYRLWYVALSRMQEVLIITSSHTKRSTNSGWNPALKTLGLGPEDTLPWPFFTLKKHEVREDATLPENLPVQARVLPEAAHTTRVFPAAKVPMVLSPTAAKRLFQDEALVEDRAEVQHDETALPIGAATTIGTLVHFAIGENWRSNDPEAMQKLLTQEVLTDFSQEDRRGMLDRVKCFLRAYEALLGNDLPALSERLNDQAELPLTLRAASFLWQGVIDRLYTDARTGELVLEDYKTDETPQPERYHLPLGVYARAVRETIGREPLTRLVFLETGAVEVVTKEQREAALAAFEAKMMV